MTAGVGLAVGAGSVEAVGAGMELGEAAGAVWVPQAGKRSRLKVKSRASTRLIAFMVPSP